MGVVRDGYPRQSAGGFYQSVNKRAECGGGGVLNASGDGSHGAVVRNDAFTGI